MSRDNKGGQGMFRTGWCVAACAGAVLLVAQPAAAEVVDSSGSGFQVREAVTVAAPSNKVYDALVHPASWWDPADTFSGDATSLVFEAVAGHCFCEALPDGGTAQHLVVALAAPGKQLVLRGELGPLLAMGVAGALSIDLKANGDNTDLTWTYAVGGYVSGGFDDLPARVDTMLGGQVARLKAYIETGKPE